MKGIFSLSQTSTVKRASCVGEQPKKKVTVKKTPNKAAPEPYIPTSPRSNQIQQQEQTPKRNSSLQETRERSTPVKMSSTRKSSTINNTKSPETKKPTTPKKEVETKEIDIDQLKEKYEQLKEEYEAELQKNTELEEQKDQLHKEVMHIFSNQVHLEKGHIPKDMREEETVQE